MPVKDINLHINQLSPLRSHSIPPLHHNVSTIPPLDPVLSPPKIPLNSHAIIIPCGKQRFYQHLLIVWPLINQTITIVSTIYFILVYVLNFTKNPTRIPRFCRVSMSLLLGDLFHITATKIWWRFFSPIVGCIISIGSWDNLQGNPLYLMRSKTSKTHIVSGFLIFPKKKHPFFFYIYQNPRFFGHPTLNAPARILGRASACRWASPARLRGSPSTLGSRRCRRRFFLRRFLSWDFTV